MAPGRNPLQQVSINCNRVFVSNSDYTLNETKFYLG